MAVAAAFIFCIALDAAMCRHYGPNADLSQNYNELASVWRGNVLLDHWTLTSDNYVFTDLPFFVLLRALLGYHLWLLDVEPVLVFTVLLATAMALAARAAPLGLRLFAAAAVLYCLGLPMGMGIETFLQPAIHTATITFCLLALLCAQPVLLGRAAAPWNFFGFFLFLAAAAASDPMAQLFLSAPLMVFLALRLWLFRRLARDEILLGVAALAAAVFGVALPYVMASNHGFRVVTGTVGLFVTSGAALLANVEAFLRCLQILFQAKPSYLPGAPLRFVVAATRALAAAAILFASLAAAWRMPRAPAQATAQLLLIAAALCAVVEVLSTTFSAAIWKPPLYPGAVLRYVAPVFILFVVGGVSAAAGLAPHLPPRWRRRIGSIGIGFAICFGVAGAVRVQAVAAGPSGVTMAPQRPVTAWLQAHGLSRGVGDYWTVQMVMALSNGRILAAPVIKDGLGKLLPVIWVNDSSLFRRIGQPQFVVFNENNNFEVDAAGAAATYGPIASVNRVGSYTVLVLQNATAGAR